MAFQATLVPDGRTAERRQTDLRATARGEDGRPDDVTVFDLSLSGFRISAVPGLAIGSTLTLGMSGVGVRRAIVIRGAGEALGCAFEQALSYDELHNALTGDTVVQVDFVAADETRTDAESGERPWSILPVVLVAATAWVLAGLFILAVMSGTV